MICLVKGCDAQINKVLGPQQTRFRCFKFHPMTLTIVASWISSLLAWKLETIWRTLVMRLLLAVAQATAETQRM